jgi:hypothetical protein
MLRPTVSRLVCLGVKRSSGTSDQILITVRSWWVCWCGVSPLTRGRVCRLQLLLVFASLFILRFEYRRNRDHILLSQTRCSPTWRVRYPYQKQGGPVILPCTGFPFRHLLRLAWLLWRYSNQNQRQSRSYVTTDDQSVSLSWNKAPIWGLRPDLYYCQIFLGGGGLVGGGALSNERTGLSFARVTVSSNKSVVNMYNLHFTCY